MPRWAWGTAAGAGVQAGHQVHQSDLLVAAPVAAALLECKALLAALLPPRSPAITDCTSAKRALHRDAAAGSWFETDILALYTLPCNHFSSSEHCAPFTL